MQVLTLGGEAGWKRVGDCRCDGCRERFRLVALRAARAADAAV